MNYMLIALGVPDGTLSTSISFSTHRMFLTEHKAVVLT